MNQEMSLTFRVPQFELNEDPACEQSKRAQKYNQYDTRD